MTAAGLSWTGGSGLAQTGAAPTETVPSHRAEIEAVVAHDGRATVHERFTLDPMPSTIELEWLVAPCVPLEELTVTVDDTAWVVEAADGGPWMRVRAMSPIAPPTPTGAPLVIVYRARLGQRTSTLPVVMPRGTLTREPGTRGAAIDLRVTFESDGRVRLPQLAAASNPHEWRARLLAVPSMLRLEVPDASDAACGTALSGSTGGLEWRVSTFVATMAVWIPLYFWRFGRRVGTDA